MDRILIFSTSALLFCNLVCSQMIFTPVVETSHGRLRGLRSFAGVNRYYGIPYATSQRFQPPQEPPPFDGVFNAVRRFQLCAQTIAFVTVDTEDCHHLDVYAPEHVAPSTRLPVMVFFHGGAFYYGTKDLFIPDFLVAKNIIAVIVNYRVSVLGFLCLHGVANLGLKDQVAALKWVRKNIAAFGGDPDNVTLIGQSAGAAAVGMHMMSKKSKGLFHKAIMISGSPFTPWAFNLEPAVPTYKDVNKMVKVNTIEDMYRVLAEYPVRNILKVTKGRSDHTRYLKYTPCVDSNLTDPFFHDTPYNIITSGDFNKVPVMIGMTDLEGLLFYGINNEKSFKDWEENFVGRLPSVFSWCSEEDRKNLAMKIRKHYFGSKRVERQSYKSVISFYSDWITDATTNAFSQLLLKHSAQPVYNYVFSYVGDLSLLTHIFGGGLNLNGTTHVDDLFYMFKMLGWSPVLSNADKLTVDRYTTLLTNFMKFGKPVVRTSRLLPVLWQPSTAEESKTLHLDHALSVTGQPWPQPNFLLSLLCRHGHSGYVPCESEQLCNLDRKD